MDLAKQVTSALDMTKLWWSSGVPKNDRMWSYPIQLFKN